MEAAAIVVSGPLVTGPRAVLPNPEISVPTPLIVPASQAPPAVSAIETNTVHIVSAIAGRYFAVITGSRRDARLKMVSGDASVEAYVSKLLDTTGSSNGVQLTILARAAQLLD